MLPIADFPDEIVFQHVLGFTAGVSWEPIKPGVAADESHLSSLGTGAVAASGTGSDPIKPGLASGEGAGGGRSVAEEAVEAATEELATRPALHVWDRAVTPPTPTCPPTRTVSASWPPARSTTPDASVASGPSLAALATGAALVVHPSDLSRIGVSAEGDDVRVTTPRGTVTIAVRTDAATAPGTAFMAVRPARRRRPQRPRDLADAVTDLRVETTR